MTDQPTDVLRAAAQKIRDLAKAIEAPDLPDQTWHTEACADDERSNCPCIVAQGRYTDGPGPTTAMYYVADAETPECADWIATMHPGVGTALAKLLEAVLSNNREASPAHEECDPWCSPETCDLSAALAVARAILGTPDGQP